jgi:RimJ/RimL family protein N-acetyltransferase
MLSDAEEIFAAVTPALTRYLSFEPASSLEALKATLASWLPAMTVGTDLHMALRRRETGEFIGMAGAHRIATPLPELGIWIKEPAQRQGYGREAVAAIRDWVADVRRPEGFHYLVAEQNLPSHRIARSLGGVRAGMQEHPKYRAIVYLLPTGTRAGRRLPAS